MGMTRTPQDFRMMSCHNMEMTSAYDQSLPISKKVLHRCSPDLIRSIAGSRFSLGKISPAIGPPSLRPSIAKAITEMQK